uniref:protein YIPF1-like n=1 Tax=Styela clava TaxID=7725 RepID=UPI0019395E3A|nr:protein YIPF1-like [Styela clava]
MASNTSDEYSLWETDGKIDQPLEGVSVGSSSNDGKTHTFTKFPSSAVDEEDDEETGGDSAKLVNKKSSPIWSFDFYKELFDVDTYVVLGRIKGSVLPIPSADYHRNYIGGNPDVYGPFWICATLVMTIAICGNLTTYFNNFSDVNYNYNPEFHRLVIAMVIVYGYTFLIPLVIRGILFFTKMQASYGYLDILCLYGYSMFMFIPLSFLLLIPNCTVEWILVVITAVISGMVILVSLWPKMREEGTKRTMIILAVVFVLHFAFSLSFRLYFFSSIKCSPWMDSSNSTVVNNTTQPAIIATTHIGTIAA